MLSCCSIAILIITNDDILLMHLQYQLSSRSGCPQWVLEASHELQFCFETKKNLYLNMQSIAIVKLCLFLVAATNAVSAAAVSSSSETASATASTSATASASATSSSSTNKADNKSDSKDLDGEKLAKMIDCFAPYEPNASTRNNNSKVGGDKKKIHFCKTDKGHEDQICKFDGTHKLTESNEKPEYYWNCQMETCDAWNEPKPEQQKCVDMLK